MWIVFYWVWAGLGCAIAGLAWTIAASFAGGMSSVMEEFGRSRVSVGSALLAELAAFLGLLLAHLGLITLVTCYGLWGFRKWGLTIAKVLSIVFLVLGVLGVVFSLITRAGIVAALVNTLISAGVMIYLFGSINLAGGIRRYSTRLRAQMAAPEWERFE